MDQLFNAQLWTWRNQTQAIIFSDVNNINNLINNNLIGYSSILNGHFNPVSFEPNITLNKDEYMFVDINVKQKEEIQEKYTSLLDNSTSINEIQGDQFSEINLFYYMERQQCWEIKVFFTKVYPSAYIKNKTFLNISLNGVEIYNHENIISFTGSVDVFYDWRDKIYFRNFDTAKSVFPFLADFYRNATKNEIDKFLNWDIIENRSLDLNKISIRQSKQIASIIDNNSIDFTNAETRQKYIQYAWNFFENNDAIQISNEWKFVIEKPSDLTKVLKLLQWHYYEDYITREKMEASSVKKLT